MAKPDQMLDIVGFYCLFACNTQITLFSHLRSPIITLCYCIPNLNKRILEFLEAYDYFLFWVFHAMLQPFKQDKILFLLFDNSEIIVHNDHNTVFMISGQKNEM